MNSHDIKPAPALTAEQIDLVNKLDEVDIKRIDDTLLSNSSQKWCKVALVVGKTMMELSECIPGIPDIYYAQRIRYLVEIGELESQGDLAYMRYSEIRLPSQNDL